jgi:hypothetical protein
MSSKRQGFPGRRETKKPPESSGFFQVSAD